MRLFIPNRSLSTLYPRVLGSRYVCYRGRFVVEALCDRELRRGRAVLGVCWNLTGRRCQPSASVPRLEELPEPESSSPSLGQTLQIGVPRAEPSDCLFGGSGFSAMTSSCRWRAPVTTGIIDCSKAVARKLWSGRGELRCSCDLLQSSCKEVRLVRGGVREGQVLRMCCADGGRRL
jgi:hypothetical protein